MPQVEELKRPEPRLDPDSKHYWEGVREKELRLQRCDDCGLVRFYSRFLCPGCWSRKVSWIVASGLGNIYTFSIVHRAPLAFVDLVPYVVVLVKLDEGPFIMANILGADVDDIQIGHRVEAVYPQDPDQPALVQFALR